MSQPEQPPNNHKPINQSSFNSSAIETVIRVVLLGLILAWDFNIIRV